MSENPYRSSNSYFGAMREKRPGVLVFMAGIVTTALACLLEYFLERQFDINLMGWYMWGIVPGGAFLVGIAAGSGYLLLAWFSGVKFSPTVFLLIGLIQLAGYGCAQYLVFAEWQDVNQAADVNFIDYYDANTRAIAVERRGNVSPPLGALGYGVRALEIIGFVLGGVAAPFMLAGSAYCDECQIYKRKRMLTYIPVGSQLKKVEKVNEQGETQVPPAYTYSGAARKIVEQMLDSVQSGEAPALARLVKEHGVQVSRAKKAAAYLEARQEYCPRCQAADLVFTMVTRRTAADKNGVKTEIARASQDAKFWSDLFAKRT